MRRKWRALLVAAATAAATLTPATAHAGTYWMGSIYVNNFWAGSIQSINRTTTGSCRTQTYTTYLDSWWTANITSIKVSGLLSCNSIRVHQHATRFGIPPNWAGFNCIGPRTMINLDKYLNDNTDAITWRYTAGCAVGS